MLKRSTQKGFTIIEAMVAVTVLSIGVAGMAGLINVITLAGERMAFQRRANEVFVAFAAQVEDAQCDCVGANCGVATISDPGLNPGGFNAFILPGGACPAVASAITMCGDQTAWDPPGQFSPALQLSYIVVPAGAPLPGAPPSFDITVRIREIMDVPAQNTVANGYWIRDYPLKKTCTLRYDRTGAPGCTSPSCGRGEFN